MLIRPEHSHFSSSPGLRYANRRRPPAIAPTEVRTLGPVRHPQALNHPAVYDVRAPISPASKMSHPRLAGRRAQRPWIVELAPRASALLMVRDSQSL